MESKRPYKFSIIKIGKYKNPYPPFKEKGESISEYENAGIYAQLYQIHVENPHWREVLDSSYRSPIVFSNFAYRPGVSLTFPTEQHAFSAHLFFDEKFDWAKQFAVESKSELSKTHDMEWVKAAASVKGVYKKMNWKRPKNFVPDYDFSSCEANSKDEKNDEDDGVRDEYERRLKEVLWKKYNKYDENNKKAHDILLATGMALLVKPDGSRHEELMYIRDRVRLDYFDYHEYGLKIDRSLTEDGDKRKINRDLGNVGVVITTLLHSKDSTSSDEKDIKEKKDGDRENKDEKENKDGDRENKNNKENRNNKENKDGKKEYDGKEDEDSKEENDGKEDKYKKEDKNKKENVTDFKYLISKITYNTDGIEVTVEEKMKMDRELLKRQIQKENKLKEQGVKLPNEVKPRKVEEKCDSQSSNRDKPCTINCWDCYRKRKNAIKIELKSNNCSGENSKKRKLSVD